MFRLSALSSLALSLSLLACEPIDPVIEGGPSPEDGVWQMEITHVDAKGRCGAVGLSDLEGLVLEMDVDSKGDHGIRFDIEGLDLKGFKDEGIVHAEGRITMDSTVAVVVDDGGDVDEPEVGDSSISETGQEAHRTERPELDREEGEGMHAVLDAMTRTSTWMSGELVLEYDRSDLKCVMVLEFEASHDGEHTHSTDPYAPKPEPSDETDEDIGIGSVED